MRTSISRTELFAFIRMLGGNPYDTRHVEIAPDGIKVTTFRRDEQGNRVIAGDDAATDVTTIAIVGSDGDHATVRMRHPNLDTEIDVPATAVGHHAVAGWEAVAPYDQGGELPTGETTAKTTEAEPAVPLKQTPEQPAPETKSETPRGRRKAKEE